MVAVFIVCQMWRPCWAGPFTHWLLYFACLLSHRRHAYDIARHLDYEQYVNHMARRYCETHHTWLFRFLFGGNEEGTERYDLLAPLLHIKFDGSSHWDNNVLVQIKACLKRASFNPPYDAADATFHQKVMIDVFGELSSAVSAGL